MTIDRLYHSIMLALQRTGTRRGNYLRKHRLFHQIGQNVSIQSRKIPLYPELISIHNNVHIASGVTFITHDISYRMLNAAPQTAGKGYMETVGCIEIMDNVFIGAGTTILYNVRIGENVIVAAGSVVTKDLPSGGIYAGVPARRIESMEEYLEKLGKKTPYPAELRPSGQKVSPGLEEYMWKVFQNEKEATE